jgi:trehalose-phosphatase
MRAPLREVTERLVTAYRTGSRLALLFDYDGTLTPLVEHPALAVLDPGTRALLRSLACRPGVAVGVFSGRGLAELRHLVALPGLYYAGTGGLELDLRGTRVTHPGAEARRRLLGAALDGLAAVARDYPGAWVEDKGLGLTLHYRGVAPGRLAGLWERAGEVLRKSVGKVRVVGGPMVWEVAPALGWDKGSALRVVVQAVGGPAVPLYAGDSGNDVEALEAAAALGGVSVGVGPDAPPAAQYRLHDPAELVHFLTGLAEALGDPGPATAAMPPRRGRRRGAAVIDGRRE